MIQIIAVHLHNIQPSLFQVIQWLERYSPGKMRRTTMSSHTTTVNSHRTTVNSHRPQ